MLFFHTGICLSLHWVNKTVVNFVWLTKTISGVEDMDQKSGKLKKLVIPLAAAVAVAAVAVMALGGFSGGQGGPPAGAAGAAAAC